MKQSHFTELIKPILAALVMFSVIAYFFTCLFSHVKPDPQIIIAMVGFGGTILGYYFGNTSGNSKKDEIIQKSIEKEN